MKRVDWYISKTVVLTSLVALLVLLTLDAFIGLLGELKDLGEADYELLEAFQYILLTLPWRIYQVFPMALLMGGLLGMGALANGSELIVMRSAGLSILRLVWPALKAGLVLGLLALALGELVAPKMQQEAREFRAITQSKALTIRSGLGFWARDGDYFINIRAILPNSRLVDIHIYEIDGQSVLKSIAWAQGARYIAGHWVLDGVNRSVILPDAVASEQLASLTMDSVVKPKMLKVLALDPENLSMRYLRIFIDYLQNNGLDAGPYQLAFWIKAVAPLTNLIMLFIAMPFVFGAQRSAGFGQRLVVGICLGLLFFLLSRMLGNMVLLYHYPALVGALLPPLLFLGAGIYAMRRMR